MTAEEAMKIFDRHGLTGRVPHLDVLVAVALKRVEAERDTVNDALIEALDHAIFYERDRDQCARERDAYKAERDAARALLAEVRSTVGAAVHELEVGEASDFLDGTIRTPRRQAEEYKRAAADLTWVRVELRGLLGELAAYDTTTGEAHP